MTKSRTKLNVAVTFGTLLILMTRASAQRQMEKLGRGVVAINQGDGRVYVGWRMLGTDPDNIAFNVYRNNTRVNSQPITESTNLVDNNGSTSAAYTVRIVINGFEGEPFEPAGVWTQNYLSIPLQTPEGCTPNDASVGDLDGDGEYEIVLHQAPRGRDNARSGMTDEPIFEAYKLDGTFLWRINLGKNIREGAHYTQFMVYDLDGDGKAEFACKTADGTVDGKGKVIGDAHADYRNSRGYILDGPEFLTIFDGQRPSLIMCRGYYTRAVLTAWNFRDGILTRDFGPLIVTMVLRVIEIIGDREIIISASVILTAMVKMKLYMGHVQLMMMEQDSIRQV